eukprot:CAMPEP_0177476382 /NCGR_PEP_ID=MMETSP0369-20130122/23550_1 /TAXON_ID=447022 ORGANISM="Scrippsiella hangoei-like, Strain SHHI-4" /NCGR_SAMPLE_ID=MMETSP0369 /ASSEMBLY_ACC=CAM_ASM_000364 /LENGTH=376 /DNA_ID=CAMNT_0018951595 /DNA_START=56 /DNA_END=1183 /DNA_ORIENTATION=+
MKKASKSLRRIVAAVAATGALACAAGLAWMQAPSTDASRRPLEPTVAAAKAVPPSVAQTSEELSFGTAGSGFAAAAVAVAVGAAAALTKGRPARAKAARSPKTALRASFFEPRKGWSKVRPYPIGVEEFADKIFWSVTLTKPFGLRIANGPQGGGMGCGVAEMAPTGSASALLDKALQDGSMWVQEGDELQSVNGEDVGGDADTAMQMLMQAEGEVQMTFARKKKGPVKVVFPNGKHITANRSAVLKDLAAACDFSYGCMCKDGKCGKCWFRDPKTDELYIMGLNCPGIFPSIFRKKEEGAAGVVTDFETWQILQLEAPPEGTYQRVMAEEEKEQARAGSNMSKMAIESGGQQRSQVKFGLHSNICSVQTDKHEIA